MNKYLDTFYIIPEDRGCIEIPNQNKKSLHLSYKESEFRVLAPVTAFTLGTSLKVLDKLIFDIGASYSYQKYNYIDLFPVNGDVRPDYDNIHESVWSIISTISYRL